MCQSAKNHCFNIMFNFQFQSYNIFILQMNRGVRADIRASKERKAQGNKDKLNRSKSKSRSKSPQLNLKKSNKKIPRTSRDKNARNRSKSRSPSIARSKSKNGLNKSASSKKIKRNASQPKIGSATKPKNNQVSPQKGGNNNSSLVKDTSNGKKVISAKQQLPQNDRKPQSMIKQQQKDMGLILLIPDSEKIMLKQIDTLDEAFEKFLQMISNDNDTSYVMNALPELRDLRKEDDTGGRDFISGKITRLSGVFQNLNIQKITSPLRKVPMYYNGQSGKNLQIMKIILQTKFKIQVDLGFLQYSLDGDKITIFRIYISKIYRKMNYTAFSYLQILKLLMEKHPAADRWSIFILERNLNIHKFFKYMGLKIEKVITDSKIKNNVQYYQQFMIKKKELQTSISAFK